MEKQLYYTSHVFCCVNERVPDHERGSCKALGAEKLQNYMKARAKELGLTEGESKIRINKSLCLDRCELGPILVIYPEGVWYHYETITDVEEILTGHLQNGRIVERLRVSPDQEAL